MHMTVTLQYIIFMYIFTFTLYIYLYSHTVCYLIIAPLFQNVSAALTGPDSGPDIKSMYENFVREVYAMHSASSFRK